MKINYELDYYDFGRLAKSYKRFGRGPGFKGCTTRKEWINNWRMIVVYHEYMDCQMYLVEDALREYFDKHHIFWYSDGSSFDCIINRKQYNDIQNIIEDILYCEDDFFED